MVSPGSPFLPMTSKSKHLAWNFLHLLHWENPEDVWGITINNHQLGDREKEKNIQE